MSARPGSGAAVAAAAPRPAEAGPRVRLPEQLRHRPGAPRPAGPCPGQRRGSRHVCGLGAAAQPRAGGDRGKEAPGGVGGGDAGSLGRAATPRSPRPPRAACAAGHSPISRSRGFTAQESRAPFSPLLPSHGGSRVSLPGGPRQRQDPGRGGCHRAGAEPQPLYRTGQSSCPAPGNPGWPSAASPRTSRPEATWGKAPCRAAQVGEGTRPWAPAGRGTLQPRPPTRAAAALLPTPQPPPRRKEQGEK